MKQVISGGLAALSLFAFSALRPPQGAAQCCGSEQCSGDFNCDGQVTIDELILAVNNALNGCSMPVGADQACADFATANCGKLDECVLNGTTIRYGGATTCQVRQKQACLVRLGANGTGNNPDAVEACVSEVPTASCADFDSGSIPECEAKIGSLADGAACTFGGQCKSSNCAIVNGTNCGTCAEPNQAGDSCATTSCSQGFVCVAASQQCQPRGSAGANCDADHPCGPALSCVTPAQAASGTCQDAGESEGTACDPKRQSGAGCDPSSGLYCDSASNTCLPAMHAIAGGQCGSVNHVTVVCTVASTCFGAQGQTPGACLANVPEGMPCDTQAGPSCLLPAQCVTGGPTATSGTCRLPDPTACG
jgi:hypothetical protein